MAKYTNDEAPDAYLAVIATADKQILCSQQPTSYAEASATYNLAEVALTPGDGNGDFTIGDGVTSGRRLTIAAQADVPVSVTGEVTHVAYVLTTDSKLLHVTTCTATAVQDGGTVDVGSHYIEVADPS